MKTLKKMTCKRRTLVLDTSAFIAGFDPLTINDEQYSVPLVKEELAPHSMSLVRFNAAVESGKLKVKTPNDKFLSRIKRSSRTVGDSLCLSEADKQVLALAFELKNKGHTPLIVTDDYSIQNVANQVQVDFAPLATFGIRYRLYWIRYCPACHKKYPSEYKHKRCKVCGTELRRKALRRTLVKKK